MDEQEIYLSTWFSRELANMQIFFDYWKENQKKNPEAFPDKMPEGEWDEQYRIWSS